MKQISAADDYASPRIISWMPCPCARCGAEVVGPVIMSWSGNVKVGSVVGPGYPPEVQTVRHECVIPPGAEHE